MIHWFSFLSPDVVWVKMNQTTLQCNPEKSTVQNEPLIHPWNIFYPYKNQVVNLDT